MTQVKTTYNGIKCATRKRTIFYLFLFFVISIIVYRIELRFFSPIIWNVPELYRIIIGLSIGFFITVWLYLMQLERIQEELTSNIRSLLEHLRTLKPESPGKKITVDGMHCDDELHEIVNVINSKSLQIQDHIDYLKKLIWYIQHEFKTPLSIIQLHNERLKKSWAKHQESVTSIESEVTHLSSLVESIIWLLSAQDTEIHEDIEPIDMWSLVRQIWWELTNIKKNSNISYTWEETVHVRSYQPFVKAIFRNLMDNALTHGSDSISIHIAEDKIDIIDQWTWISDDYYEQIRLPFWKKPSTKESSEWLWLWLSLVKELIEKLWRSIQASSNNLWWMTFTVFFNH